MRLQFRLRRVISSHQTMREHAYQMSGLLLDPVISPALSVAQEGLFAGLCMLAVRQLLD
jgi:hypothetical protein